jgi:hypothetical protein
MEKRKILIPLIFIVVLLLLYQSCKEDGKITSTNDIVNGKHVLIIEYKNHQYIEFSGDDHCWGAHYPDCIFCKMSTKQLR